MNECEIGYKGRNTPTSAPTLDSKLHNTTTACYIAAVLLGIQCLSAHMNCGLMQNQCLHQYHVKTSRQRKCGVSTVLFSSLPVYEVKTGGRVQERVTLVKKPFHAEFSPSDSPPTIRRAILRTSGNGRTSLRRNSFAPAKANRHAPAVAEITARMNTLAKAGRRWWGGGYASKNILVRSCRHVKRNRRQSNPTRQSPHADDRPAQSASVQHRYPS